MRTPRATVAAVSAAALVTASLATAPLATAPLAAQPAPADSAGALPFRAGQWALAGSVQGDAPGLGVMRFVSPGSALSLDVTLTASRNRADVGEGDLQLDVLETALALGYRRHRAIRRSVVGVAGVGPLVTYVRRSDESPGATPTEPRNHSRFSQTGIGGFVELGGMYVLDARFGLGVASGLRAVVERSTQRTTVGGTAQPPVDGSVWTVSLPPMRVTATLLF